MSNRKLDMDGRPLCPDCDGTKFVMVDRSLRHPVSGVERSVPFAEPCERCGHTTAIAKRLAAQRSRLERQEQRPTSTETPKPIGDVANDDGLSLDEITRRAKEHQ